MSLPRPTPLQALNAVKTNLAELEQENGALTKSLAARQQELQDFDRDFAQTSLQAGGIEKTYKQLRAEQHNTWVQRQSSTKSLCCCTLDHKRSVCHCSCFGR